MSNLDLDALLVKDAERPTLEMRIEIAGDFVSAALADESLIPKFQEVAGSTYIRGCDTSDVDVLVCIPGSDASCFQHPAWTTDSSYDNAQGKFNSWKAVAPGDVLVNLIIVFDEDYYWDWLRAAEVCRYLYLSGITLPKNLVCGVHAVIMDEADAFEERKKRGGNVTDEVA